MYHKVSRPTIAAIALTAIGALAVSVAQAALIDLTPQGNAINSVNSVTFASLQANPNDSIVVGDKIFTGFSYSRIGDMPLAQNINVLGFRDPFGNWGLSFHGAFKDLPGGGDSDALIRFMVEVDPAAQAQGWRISDAHLFVNGVGMPDESYFLVDESFFESNQTLNAGKTTLGAGQSNLQDAVVFNSLLTKLTVTKDILAFAADDATAPARATSIDQSFSQELIPEPATLILAGLSTIAVFVSRRRR